MGFCGRLLVSQTLPVTDLYSGSIRSYLQRSQVKVDFVLEVFANALGGDGVEVGFGQDAVDEGAVGGTLLGRNCDRAS